MLLLVYPFCYGVAHGLVLALLHPLHKVSIKPKLLPAVEFEESAHILGMLI